MKRAYVFLNGELLGQNEFYKGYIADYPGDIFCADGGYNHLEKMFLTPLEIWGDMDSIDKKLLSELENKDEIILKKFKIDKDYTDGELLVSYLNSLGYDELVVIGGLGGKKSHELTNLNLFGKYQNLIFLTQKEKIFYLKKNSVLRNLKNTIISLIPLASSVENLNLKGFEYNLENYNLNLGDSRCISNKILINAAKISYNTGILLGILEIG
ncbi:MAG: thiamine diphosphokinase [Fusobacteriaceae bacterium]